MCLWKDCQQQQLSRLLRIATKTVLKTTTIKPCGCPPLLEDHQDKLPAGAKRQQLTRKAQPPPRRRRRTARRPHCATVATHQYCSKKQEGTRTQTGPQEHRQTNGAPPQTRPNGIGTGQGTRTIRPAGHHKRQTDSSHARTRSARGHTQAGPLTRKGPDPWRPRDRRRLRAGPDRAAPTSSGRGRGP